MNALTTPLCALPGIKVPIVQATIGSAATLAPAAAVCGAGGHVRGETTTMTLLPATVDAVGPVPVVAAGGIGDGRGLAAVLARTTSWRSTRTRVPAVVTIRRSRQPARRVILPRWPSTRASRPFWPVSPGPPRKSSRQSPGKPLAFSAGQPERR